MGKTIVLTVAAVLLAALTWAALYFRARLPPDCNDPRTIALVNQSLVRQHLPATARLDRIHTVAGGMLALRFVCEATLTGFDPHDLPPGMSLPGTVHYTSRLTLDGARHEVTVTIQPLLIWEKVQ